MVFLEIVGALVLLTIFGVGAWRIVGYLTNKEKQDEQR
jgi:hypothetical protein